MVNHYFYADENGEPDLSRPMPKEEMIKLYWQVADEDPESLADLYLDFHDFDQIEFLVFRGNLSAAVLVARSTGKEIAALMSDLDDKLKEASRTAKWGEATMALEGSLSTAKEAYRISIGASMLTAVAALESLLIDLTPGADPKESGLYRLLQALLKRYGVGQPEADRVTKLGRKVSQRRNVFAHSLTGSYFSRDKTVQAMFTPQTLEDTLYSVGTIAILLEDIVERDAPSGPAPPGRRC